MLDRYRNIIIGVGSFIIFVFIIQMIFVKTIPKPDFKYSTYEQKQVAFNTCYGDGLTAKQKELQSFIKTVKTTKNVKDNKQNSLDLLTKTSCNVSFVSQSDKQIREIAKEVLPYAQSFFHDSNVKLLNTVYTSDQQFSAILQKPRQYLFYGVTNDKKTMVAFLAIPKADGHFEIHALWDKDKGSDEAYTKNMISKLLLVYNSKVF